MDGRLEVGLLGVDHDPDVKLLRHLVEKHETFCWFVVRSGGIKKKSGKIEETRSSG